MNKKKYISPAVDELVVYISDGILAGSNSGGITIGGEDDGKTDTGAGNMSAGKRGTWGSLWQ